MLCPVRMKRTEEHLKTHGKEVVGTLGNQSGISTCSDLAVTTNLERGSGMLPGSSVQLLGFFAT